MAALYGPKAYCAADFKKIARAIDKSDAVVLRHAQLFESAARWYRLRRNGDKAKRLAPSAIQKRMTQIANAARKLLNHLQIFDVQPKRPMVQELPCSKFSHQQTIRVRTT